MRSVAAPPTRVLLLIHGFKGDENSMWVFARDLPGDYLLVAPRAPYAVSDGGFSWREPPEEVAGLDQDSEKANAGFVLSADDSSTLPSLAMFEPAVNRLLEFVDSFGGSRGVDTTQFDVMGFSQGGVMTSLLALLHPDRVRKAAVLAGFLPRHVEPLIASRPLVEKSIFVTHGTSDDRVPPELARRSIALLEQAGAKVTYCEDDVGHKVSSTCLRALKAYLQD
ncbi:MAG TPA: hypothetical protein VGJ22_14180 [Anaerolineales bacterium]